MGEEVKRYFQEWEVGRKTDDPDFELPDLTFAEGARLLRIDEGAFMQWVMKTARPSEGRWSEWCNAKRPLPERLIRLYLTQQRAEPVRLRGIGGAGRAAERPEGAKGS